MTVKLVAHGNLNQDTLESCLLFIEDGKDRLEVDLRKCRFADVYAMVTVLTMISVCRSANWLVIVEAPTSSALTYMTRMHFFENVPRGVEVKGSIPTVREGPSALVSLRRFDISAGSGGIYDLCEFCYPQLPNHLAVQFTVALSEIGLNVLYHSRAGVGFVAGQRFESTYQGRPGPRLQLVVGDAGIGIRDSFLPSRPDLTHENAIALSLMDGVTSKPETHSGLGLPTVRRYADLFGGVLRIRSGNALMVYRRGRFESRIVPEMRGTIVGIELASPGRRDVS